MRAHDLNEPMAHPIEVDGQEISQGILELFGGMSDEARQELRQVMESTDSAPELKELKPDLKFFPNLMDWLVMLFMVGIRHAIPDITEQSSKDLAMVLARQFAVPGNKHLWITTDWFLRRHGMKMAINRIQLELRRGLMREKNR